MCLLLQITSINYLNNIVDIVLRDGGHVLVLDTALKQCASISHRMSPQLAVDCARNLFRARYLQRDLLNKIAEVATQNMNKITPMQVGDDLNCLVREPVKSLVGQKSGDRSSHRSCDKTNCRLGLMSNLRSIDISNVKSWDKLNLQSDVKSLVG